MANITKRGKSYRIKASCGYDINGKQITKSMTWSPSPGMTERQIEKELKRQAVLFEEKCKSGQYLDSSIKFTDFIDLWWNEYATKHLKAKTLKGYQQYLKRIRPALGHIRLDKLQPVHLMRFYDNLSEEGVREDVKYLPIGNLSNIIKNTGMSKKKFSSVADLSETTIYSICRGNHAAPETANKIADALNKNVSELFKLDDTKKTLSGKMLLHHHRLISSILETAVQWQVILSNPCNRVKAPKVERKESKYLDDVQVMELFEHLEKEPIQYKAAITLFIYSGLRRGEMCGLKWEDVDFDNKVIFVRRNILYLPEKGIYEDTPKTYNSQRVIKVADTALQLLKEHKKDQNETRLKLGDRWRNEGFIFTQWDGGVMHPDSLTYWFKKFIKKYDMPDITIHSLRHTNATLLIANGVNLTTVSNRLGHSSTNTTTRIYAHAIKAADEIAADTLENLLSPQNNDQTMTKKVE